RDPKRYFEALVFLARVGRTPQLDAALNQLFKDLEDGPAERRLGALQSLLDPVVRRHVELTEAKSDTLMNLSVLHSELSGLALEVLFAFSPSPQLLIWAWARLADNKGGLGDAIRDHIDAIRSVDGTTMLLQVLGEGLGSPTTKQSALELLRK